MPVKFLIPDGDGDGAPGHAVGRGPSLLRDLNCRAILQLLQAHNPCSCSDLVRYSGLSAPTVSSSVARLTKFGLVKRLGKGSSSGGRPPRLLAFNEKCGYVAGVDIRATEIRFAIADMAGTVLGEHAQGIGTQSLPMTVVEKTAAGLAALRERLKIPAKRLFAIGVAAPGITDVDAGVVVSVPLMMEWDNVPLGRLLRQATGIPTVVENDVNLAALAEQWRGIAAGEQNFVFVSLANGVGAGLIINGQLHHGPDWTAGEIGYLIVPGAKTLPIRKTRMGTLEGAIGTAGIEHDWRQLMKSRGGAGPRQPLRAAEILECASKGEPIARQVVQKIAHILAVACSNLGLILNCSLIVLGGEIGAHPAMLQATAALL